MLNLEKISDKVVKEFMTIVRIDSLSLQEQEMFNYLEKRLKHFPVEWNFQKYVREEIDTSSGNLIIKLPSNSSQPKKSIFFDAHVDTVEPGIGIEPFIDDDIIRSKGDTILGSDDKAGVAAMIVALEEIIDSGMEHGDVYFIFTSAEEIGLFGVMEMDMSDITAEFGFILDSHGDIGGIITSAPYHYIYDIYITGKASHAGISPEKGISALKTGAQIIIDLPQGRINENTVANVGLVEGGKATNIIPDECHIKGEFRSIHKSEGEALQNMVEQVVDRYRKNAVAIKTEIIEAYPGFNFEHDEEILKITEKACHEIGVNPRFESTGGGSNTNIYIKNNIKSVTLASGMMDVHSTNEYIRIKDLTDLTRLVLKLVELA